jgi:hypothetical protein
MAARRRRREARMRMNLLSPLCVPAEDSYWSLSLLDWPCRSIECSEESWSSDTSIADGITGETTRETWELGCLGRRATSLVDSLALKYFLLALFKKNIFY